MKGIKYLLFIVISLIIFPSVILATSGKITVTSSNQAVLGNKVTVTVKLSVGASWEMDLSYDKNYLQLVSGGGEAGGTNMVNTSTGKPNRTYTFTFKTLKAGSTSLKVGSYYVVDDNFNTVSISTSPKTIKIITQSELEASYSKDNNLKSLEVEGYTLTPAFNKDTLEYGVSVPEDTKTIKIKGTLSDNRSTVTGLEEVEVSEGTNTFKVTVKAQNGSEKTYSINVNVIDENPIEVTVSDTKYTLVKLKSYIECPALFDESTIKINDLDIPSCKNTPSDISLVGLKNSEGKVLLFRYNNGAYSRYEEVVSTSLKLIPLVYDKDLKGLEKTKVSIDDKSYEAFNYKDKYYIIYALNIESGKKDFYLYDKDNNTFSLFNIDYLEEILDKNQTFLYVIYLFGIGLFLSLVALLITINKKRNIIKKIENKSDKKEEKKEAKSKQKENKKEEDNEIKEEENNEIQNILEEDTLINILEEDKPKKKKKK